ncbi:MAG: hypothetical protein HKN51_07760 [Saprospiraceae bacterium]|nr:hypothetical protein [Saprospiraceae bacterium]
MVDPKNLWVGDELRVKSSGRIGTFEGVAGNGKVRVKSGPKIYLVASTNLELYTPLEDPVTDLGIEDIDLEHKKNNSTEKVGDAIDLHTEKLSPELSNALPERIIDLQISSFDIYIEAAIKAKKHIVTIIHGKGTGVLKSIVHQRLKTEEKVFSFRELNDGGATEVVFYF